MIDCESHTFYVAKRVIDRLVISENDVSLSGYCLAEVIRRIKFAVSTVLHHKPTLTS